MTYEDDGFCDTIATLPEDIDWTKTEIYAKVPEEYVNPKPKTFFQKFFFGEYNTPWDSLPQFYIKGKPGIWACIHDPCNDFAEYTKIDEHTQDGKIVKRQVSVLTCGDDIIPHTITADWQDCLYKVLEGENAPIVVTSKKVKDL